MPPPQKKDPSKSRAARKSDTDPKNLDAPTPPYSSKINMDSEGDTLPDITLSQLLTLHLSDLSVEIGIPITKLTSMTLMELTSYVENLLKSKKTNNEAPVETPNDSPVFKVTQ